jgi:uncharacterized lipoprotein YehR (DUF1307 family)
MILKKAGVLLLAAFIIVSIAGCGKKTGRSNAAGKEEIQVNDKETKIDAKKDGVRVGDDGTKIETKNGRVKINSGDDN